MWLDCVGDAEAGEDDEASDPEYNIMMEEVDDEDEEEVRNDKATRVSSRFHNLCMFANMHISYLGAIVHFLVVLVPTTHHLKDTFYWHHSLLVKPSRRLRTSVYLEIGR